MPSTVLGTEDKAGNRRDTNSCLPEASIFMCILGAGGGREIGGQESHNNAGIDLRQLLRNN